MTITYLTGDALDTLRTLPAGAFRCCVTSPPYYGLRSYLPAEHPDKPREIGLEVTPDEYIAALVAVFREVRRCLTDDGTLWVNIGDSYAVSWGAQGRGGPPSEASTLNGGGGPKLKSLSAVQIAAHPRKQSGTGSVAHLDGVKAKNLLGIPWMLAFALRADGWYLRRDIIWHKPNAMPESVRDRPTSAHEYVFLMAKSERYYYDQNAVREPHTSDVRGENDPKLRAALGHDAGKQFVKGGLRRPPSRPAKYFGHALGRNRRSVWTIATEPCAVAHYAVMPNALAELCVLAGTKAGDHVLDPFGGGGTTGLVAERLNRHSTLIDLDPRNKARFAGGDTPLFAGAAS